MIECTEIDLLKKGTRELEGPLSFILEKNKGNTERKENAFGRESFMNFQ